MERRRRLILARRAARRDHVLFTDFLKDAREFTIVVPIVEEILHTERRLILKEEVRITRRKTTEQFLDRVTLRYQEAVVTRVQSASEAVDNASTKESK